MTRLSAQPQYIIMSHSAAPCLKINDQKVVSETVSGETIVINLETGTYYSLNETASFLWDNIMRKIRIDDLINLCERAYKDDSESVANSVRAFVEEMISEQLVSESDEEPGAFLSEVATLKPFVPPKFEIYSDMQEMLLADPIHDVDATGWPKLKDARNGN